MDLRLFCLLLPLLLLLLLLLLLNLALWLCGRECTQGASEEKHYCLQSCFAAVCFRASITTVKVQIVELTSDGYDWVVGCRLGLARFAV
jgi:hypothetical protein